MSSSSSTDLPSPTELENLGVLFIGCVAATILYGLTFFQTYIYYTRYPKDHQWIKYLVTVLCLLDTAASALVSEVLYYYLIILFDVNLDILFATTTFCVQYLLSVLLTFISHLFFTHRVFQVTQESRLVTVVLLFLSFIALVFGLTVSGQMLAQPRLSAFGTARMEITAAISQVSGAVADIIVVAVMCCSLRRERYSHLVVPDGFFPTVVTLLVGRGLAFTVVQVAYFCIFVAAPSKHYWIPLQMIASKLYVNTLLGHLNSRDVKHGRGSNEEDSFPDRKSRANGLPSSIQLNVSNIKATTQSVNFTTGQVNSASSGTDQLESKKTCEDDHGNEYTQVSTGSSKSQTDNEIDKESLSAGFS
ncbi:hypothetical protein JVU11DRAFT_3115 [Chiua virens]|nr:hypothetical protein JVU11DRAFT_3115 [Chiua virens]